MIAVILATAMIANGTIKEKIGVIGIIVTGSVRQSITANKRIVGIKIVGETGTPVVVIMTNAINVTNMIDATERIVTAAGIEKIKGKMKRNIAIEDLHLVIERGDQALKREEGDHVLEVNLQLRATFHRSKP